MSAVVLVNAAWTVPPSGSVPPIVERAPRILVIDGGGATATRLRAALQNTTYDVTVRVGADRVSRAVEEVDPDLLIVDSSLADPSAFEVCSELRATDLGRAIPILIVSTSPAAEGEVARGLMCGADDFLTVDDRVGEFQARIRVQLRNKRATAAWIAGSIATTGGLTALVLKKAATGSAAKSIPATTPATIKSTKEDHHG
jgi:DNA-binding response OmpR family regulator